ncbi:MAG: GntR family transcriptional regulator [Victivallales bacterium]|nr:GntR family transcriptional regulator [Victivallales bacterium]
MSAQISGNTLPGYHQIRRYVFTLIATADPGEALVPLTTERELCELFGMSRGTVRKALQILTDEGLLIRRQHYGTFISPQVIRRSLHMPMVGVIVGDGESSYIDSMAQSILSGLYHELGRDRYLLNNIHFFGNPQQTMMAELRGNIAAIIWIWATSDRVDLIDLIRQSGTTLINVMPKITCNYGSSINLDLYHYGYELTRRLIEQGYSSDILFLDTNDESVSCKKREGIAAAYSAAGITWDQNNYLQGSYEEIYMKAEEKLNTGHYRVVNATGSFIAFTKYYPDVKFIIPEVSLDMCPAGTKLPYLAVPAFNIGKMAVKMMREHCTCTNKPNIDQKVQLQFCQK